MYAGGGPGGGAYCCVVGGAALPEGPSDADIALESDMSSDV